MSNESDRWEVCSVLRGLAAEHDKLRAVADAARDTVMYYRQWRSAGNKIATLDRLEDAVKALDGRTVGPSLVEREQGGLF